MDTKHFLDKFNTTSTITTLTHRMDYNAVNENSENIYFIPGQHKSVDSDRLSDHHMVSTTTFFIDVDIKNNLIKTGDLAFLGLEDWSEEDHLEYAEWIKEFCDQSETFRNWSFIVFTGNGIHIHFIGHETLFDDRTSWRFGLKDIFNQWDKEVKQFFGFNVFESDKAVFNESRLRRLPGTLNSKKGVVRKCRVIYEKDSVFDLNTILYRGKIFYEKKMEQDRIQSDKDRMVMKESLSVFENNIFELTNKIPIELIVSQINPEFKFYNDKNWYTGKYREGFFKTKHNRLCNGGSHYFPPFIKNGYERDSYSCFDLIHLFLANSGDFTKESVLKTIYFIKQNYAK